MNKDPMHPEETQGDSTVIASLTPFDRQEIARTSAFASGKMFIEANPLESQEPLA